MRAQSFTFKKFPCKLENKCCFISEASFIRTLSFVHSFSWFFPSSYNHSLPTKVGKHSSCCLYLQMSQAWKEGCRSPSRPVGPAACPPLRSALHLPLQVPFPRLSTIRTGSSLPLWAVVPAINVPSLALVASSLVLMALKYIPHSWLRRGQGIKICRAPPCLSSWILPVLALLKEFVPAFPLCPLTFFSAMCQGTAPSSLPI